MDPRSIFDFKLKIFRNTGKTDKEGQIPLLSLSLSISNAIINLLTLNLANIVVIINNSFAT